MHADTDIFDILSTLDASNKQKLQNALLGMQGLDTIDALGKVQDLYQSCISTNLTNALGLAPLRDLLARTGEPWNLKNTDVCRFGEDPLAPLWCILWRDIRRYCIFIEGRVLVSC